MKQISNRLIAPAMAFFLVSHSVLADHIVLESATNRYTAGQLIEAPAMIELGEGESLVLLSDGGDVVDLAGPYHGTPVGYATDEFDLKTALVRLINSPENMQASLGSTRDPGIDSNDSEDRPAWSLNPFKNGSQCVTSRLDIRFWRAEATSELALVVQRPGHEGSGKIFWSPDEHFANWPDDVPMLNNELYVVRRQGWMENAMIRIVVLPDAITEKVETSIAWLAVYGCRNQANLLLKEL